MQLRRFAIPLAAGWLLLNFLCPVDAAEVSLRVEVGKPAHAISPRLYGIFFEDINFGGDGGLSAELVKNGSFEFPRGMMGWKESGEERGARSEEEGHEIEVLDESPAFATNPHYLRLTASADGGGVVNEGFRGMGVRAGETVFVLSAGPVQRQRCRNSPRIARYSGWQRAGRGANRWHRFAVVEVYRRVGTARNRTKSAANDRDRSTLTPALSRTERGKERGGAAVDLDMVSLCPEKTWKDRPHGLRADLVQLLADLKPAFLRFPGGCIVEGENLDSRYQWKNTIGDLAGPQALDQSLEHRVPPSAHARLFPIVRARFLRVLSFWPRTLAPSRCRFSIAAWRASSTRASWCRSMSWGRTFKTRSI